MDGPTQGAVAGTPEAAERLPGHFVSDEHRNDCARFMDEVKSLVKRRRELARVNPWFPREPPPSTLL
jgi:hypothetical protein